MSTTFEAPAIDHAGAVGHRFEHTAREGKHHQALFVQVEGSSTQWAR